MARFLPQTVLLRLLRCARSEGAAVALSADMCGCLLVERCGQEHRNRIDSYRFVDAGDRAAGQRRTQKGFTPVAGIYTITLLCFANAGYSPGESLSSTLGFFVGGAVQFASPRNEVRHEDQASGHAFGCPARRALRHFPRVSLAPMQKRTAANACALAQHYGTAIKGG